MFASILVLSFCLHAFTIIFILVVVNSEFPSSSLNREHALLQSLIQLQPICVSLIVCKCALILCDAKVEVTL